ncbi:MAG: HelD family protein [Peptococcaceae bacterium]
MGGYEQELAEEKEYLAKILTFIKNEFLNETKNLSSIKKNLLAARKEMWENTGHTSNDFTRLTEMNQYLNEVNLQTGNYQNKSLRVEKYKKILDSPYFGRFDFCENNSDRIERIYIGLTNIMEPDFANIHVYDWRAPISSIFYRYELGKAEYSTPAGISRGDVRLKRQYQISKSQLEYFFDCSVMITDEILQNILSRNTSPKMRKIVETIQKEQDLIIRDTENDLLIIQGVAGSGKTSIALHRIAYLMYHGLGSNIAANHFMIISPNKVFSKYIAHVLPELGEENVPQTTFDDLISLLLNNRFSPETKLTNLEKLINARDDIQKDLTESLQFKGSSAFIEIMDRFITYYQHHLLDFQDIYFNGKILETRQLLKNRFLNNSGEIPIAKQLQRMEKMIIEKLQPLRRERLAKIQQIVQKSEGHDLEIKSFSRLLSIKEATAFLKTLHKFTQIDYWQMYKDLFNNRQLFFNLAEGLPLPGNIRKIISDTKERLAQDLVLYEDSAPLLYMKLKVEGCREYRQIKHVIIDEAQDYAPLDYRLFKLAFKDAAYTVLGDTDQTVHRDTKEKFYHEAAKILEKEKVLHLSLNKGYRSTYELSTFARKLSDSEETVIPFDRHGSKPRIVFKATLALINQSITRDIARNLRKGYQSIAIICKTQKEARKAYDQLKDLTNLSLLNPQEELTGREVVIIPSYLAKGLEFDVVIVYDVNKDNYRSRLDRKLLYIICTRALHRLIIYHTQEKSTFL